MFWGANVRTLFHLNGNNDTLPDKLAYRPPFSAG